VTSTEVNIRKIVYSSLAIGMVASIFLSTASFAIAPQKVHLGKVGSRAIWTLAAPTDALKKHAVVILVPGSGAQGPEEMIPGALTVDKQDHSIFEAFSKALNKANVHTLALGKPGVEFFSSWKPDTYFYDKNLYANLHWNDLVENLRAAVIYVRQDPAVDVNKIYILGHSEGTQVAIDYAAQYPDIKGLILLGVMDNDIGTTLEWQLGRRYIDNFVATDLDANHDGFVSKEEAAKWPDFHWDWKPRKDKISYGEIEKVLMENLTAKAMIKSMKDMPLYSDGIYNRGPIHKKAASLRQDIYLINGSLDLQTRSTEAIAIADAAKAAGKRNVWLTILPGVGHGFSPPRPPRGQPLLDITVGPVGPKCIDRLFDLGKTINE
jgi:pimeloyl-ACP methyl ester carboxylesterase